MQSHLHAALPKRILGNWAYLYADQPKKGDSYRHRHPVLSVWVLGKNLFPDDTWFHNFLPRDDSGETVLTTDFRILILELEKWRSLSEATGRSILEDEIELWLSLFVDGENVDLEAIPEKYSTGPMREALEVMEMVTRSEIARHTRSASE
jgi:predicted transposase/invertase (TIGR01784 family)